MTGSSVVGVVGNDSFEFTFSADVLRGFTLLTVADTFGVEGVVFGVTFALGSDFILAEPLGFKTYSRWAYELWFPMIKRKMNRQLQQYLRFLLVCFVPLKSLPFRLPFQRYYPPKHYPMLLMLLMLLKFPTENILPLDYNRKDERKNRFKTNIKWCSIFAGRYSMFNLINSNLKIGSFQTFVIGIFCFCFQIVKTIF